LLKSELSGVSPIQKLDLSWNNIRKRGVRKIYDSLISNTAIKYINLSNNPLGLLGVGNIVIFLRENMSCISLKLNSCELGGEGMTAVFDGVIRSKAL
jgi:hypothetical protein